MNEAQRHQELSHVLDEDKQPIPSVTVIVPHHLDENHEYLKLCLDSILASEGVSFEVICVADTKEDIQYTSPTNQGGVLYKHHRPDLTTASAKVNWAAKQAKGKYLWIISDDVMVSKYAMRTMVEGMGENQIICNPMSNSDNGSQFYADLRGIPVKCSKEELKMEWLDRGARIPPFLIPVIHFVSFYCTMIPKTVWDKVGELDARLDARHNDEDYCVRAKNLGIVPLINLGAFALHFGDKTLLKCTTEEQRNECSRIFINKLSGSEGW